MLTFPLSMRQTQKTLYVHPMGYPSAMKENEIMLLAAWVDPEGVTVSELSQIEEKQRMTSLRCGI